MGALELNKRPGNTGNTSAPSHHPANASNQLPPPAARASALASAALSEAAGTAPAPSVLIRAAAPALASNSSLDDFELDEVIHYTGELPLDPQLSSRAEETADPGPHFSQPALAWQHAGPAPAESGDEARGPAAPDPAADAVVDDVDVWAEEERPAGQSAHGNKAPRLKVANSWEDEADEAPNGAAESAGGDGKAEEGRFGADRNPFAQYAGLAADAWSKLVHTHTHARAAPGSARDTPWLSDAALPSAYRLTPLGALLAHVPVRPARFASFTLLHPPSPSCPRRTADACLTPEQVELALGRVVVLGVALSCLDPALTVVAAFSCSKDLFQDGPTSTGFAVTTLIIRRCLAVPRALVTNNHRDTVTNLRTSRVSCRFVHPAYPESSIH